MVGIYAPNIRYWEPTTVKLSTLLNSVEQQKLALPQFQRDFKWGPKDFTPFLYSVLQNRITGSLLLLSVDRDSKQFAPKELDRGPSIDQSKLEELLLDGQQRTTTLYQAFVAGFRRYNKHYLPYIDVKQLLQSDFLLEEHIRFDEVMGRTPTEQAKHGHLELKVLLESSTRATWLQEFAQTDEIIQKGWSVAELISEMNERIVLFETLATYEFPATRLGKESPPSLIVDIFQDINRRGRRLDEFELMVAKCFNESEPNSSEPYNLKAHWDAAFSTTQFLEKIGISSDSGLLPLYLIAAALKRETTVLGAKPLGADAILSMDPKYVTGTKISGVDCSIERAVEALDKAAQLLYQACGVIHKTLLPQAMMLIPIADQFFLAHKNRPPLSDVLLRKWFWISGLRGDFYGSTTSYVTPACQQLENWSKDPNANIPASISSFDISSVNALNLRAAKVRADDIMGKTVLAMIAQSGSLDWKAGHGPLTAVVNAQGQDVEAHHIVPRKVLTQKSYYNCNVDDERLFPIANFAPASQTANGSLSVLTPSGVKSELAGDYPQILDRSFVPRGHFEKVKNKTSFEAFLAAREKALKVQIALLLDV